MEAYSSLTSTQLAGVLNVDVTRVHEKGFRASSRYGARSVGIMSGMEEN